MTRRYAETTKVPVDRSRAELEALPTMALSLWAPWAFAILHLGKTIENRSLRGAKRNGFPRHHLGDFWIHASLWPSNGRKPLSASKRDELRDQMFLAIAKSGRCLPLTAGLLDDVDNMRGKIVGRATVTGYVEESDSPWYVPGSLGIVVANPVALVTPVAASGALGWWRVLEPQMRELEAGS